MRLEREGAVLQRTRTLRTAGSGRIVRHVPDVRERRRRGDLGSNFGATKAEESKIPGQYVVTFAQSIGSCAAVAQSGKAGGDEFAGAYPSIVNFEGSDAFIVAFVNPANNQETPTPFMITVTCHD